MKRIILFSALLVALSCSENNIMPNQRLSSPKDSSVSPLVECAYKVWDHQTIWPVPTSPSGYIVPHPASILRVNINPTSTATFYRDARFPVKISMSSSGQTITVYFRANGTGSWQAKTLIWTGQKAWTFNVDKISSCWNTQAYFEMYFIRTAHPLANQMNIALQPITYPTSGHTWINGLSQGLTFSVGEN